jgi:hypothetical protein
MPSRFKNIKFRHLILVAPVLLAACDGLEPQRVEGIVPYVMERTAGTGVAYVRAKLAPQKELKLEAAQPAPAMTTPPPAPPPMSTPPAKAEEVFREQQSK